LNDECKSLAKGVGAEDQKQKKNGTMYTVKISSKAEKGFCQKLVKWYEEGKLD